ncbi:MAG TPA: hypothetical protein VFE37_17265 [Chloroflexota bacterium]|nr:hypothetical protein [Chloroflexota bacterium]
MDTAIKALVEGPLYLLLVVAGLGFLFLAVAGKVGDRVSPDKAGRLSAGGIGAGLLVLGLLMSASAGAPSRAATTAASSAAPSVPAASAAPDALAVPPNSVAAPNASMNSVRK